MRAVRFQNRKLSMKSAAKRLVTALLSRSNLGRRLVLSFGLRGYLDSCGWFRSVKEKLPVDHNGACLPWYTYPAITFLEGRINPSVAVFEYGSGNSTLWWSMQATRVTSCEHDIDWYTSFKSKMPKTVEYMHRELDGGHYCDAILAYNEAFEIIVIDGRDRVNCAKNSLSALTADGVIIWDNADREKYNPGHSYLVKSGFRRLDFWGLGPINNYQWCTSVFYRDKNCLGI
jgi:hypothetical protein